jgi:hypothetical protein
VTHDRRQQANLGEIFLGLVHEFWKLRHGNTVEGRVNLYPSPLS